LFRPAVGSIEYQSRTMYGDGFSRIRRGQACTKAHGGFLLLHLRDLHRRRAGMGELRRPCCRSGRLQIEEPVPRSPPSPQSRSNPEGRGCRGQDRADKVGCAQYYELQE